MKQQYKWLNINYVGIPINQISEERIEIIWYKNNINGSKNNHFCNVYVY